MVPIVSYNRLPGVIMPHLKLDRKPDDMSLKALVEVPSPGVIADIHFYNQRSGSTVLTAIPMRK